ncbi:hypothetical protein DICPUDRAFT_148146 [Dictyostelium purpureum]|uniref:Myb domain-containing protein n=1 Tax=Dictyostelium purpureum TaxID=5786 RepID=F0ZAD7_DICPU|nr:uncharacterized protein DICPUDRAFT_148146 [Dictyostelium purpureum]EGC39132.1 hypothetical protein DICPUDRAFT_148146 [Dictyostelium purpureum]|eukprot:XP_003284384.1 hypothetical protein DICPUDRAFT_148146 [Dictyostelium purpureum]
MSIPVTSTQEYKQLTKVLEILELQREQVLKDREFIENAYKEAIGNPVEYIESLVSGAIRLPPKINIINIPDLTGILLPTYNNKNNNVSTNSSSGSIGINSNQRLVNNNSINKENEKEVRNEIVVYKKRMNNHDESDSNFKEGENEVIRKPPRPYPRALSKTNLAYWTEEEHNRLEELLVEFPEEEVATHRWVKIANKLGNRTPAQVASRTQKYFKKLERLGLEIPGSRPKKKRSGSISSGGFEPQSSEDERRLEIKQSSNSSNSNSAANNKNSSSNSTAKVHEGYKCDGCDIEPIVGVRWHCEECMNEVDLCSKCHDELDEIGKHLSSHHMTAFENPDSYFLDDDYKYTYPTGESNYLDPNYR